MTPPRYPIPAHTTQVETRVANSRFIATIGEARTASDARTFIEGIRGKFADAHHNVYAFRAGYGASVTEGMSDDGEPPGTAGRPALAVLRGADIGDVVLVITRYFGGTKLGTGGLVRAYTEAAQAALAALPLTERVATRHGMIAVPYPLYERVRQIAAAHGGQIVRESFGGEVTLEMIFAMDDCAAFSAALREVSSGRLEMIWGD